MNFFTLPAARRLILLLAGLSLGLGVLSAQTSTNTDAPIPDPTALEGPGTSAPPRALPVDPSQLSLPGPVNPPPPAAVGAPETAIQPATRTAVAPTIPESVPAIPEAAIPPGLALAALIAFTALGGFLLLQCGLTRAKNCGHTSMLVLIGAGFGLVGYWMGGFAVQTGGVGDAHAALSQPVAAPERGMLDHELGFMAGSHHWGLMGSAGFFLATDTGSRGGIDFLFLMQAALLALSVGAALGAALERGRLVAMAVIAFLTGAVLYPLVANWVWGGGWLAEMGREFGLGHGVVDLAGAGVVHETAGALALAIALALGPRHGRFQRHKATGIPGHHVPFTILGALILLVALMASTAAANGGDALMASGSGAAVVNVLLGALGGLILTVFLAVGKAQQTTPARVSRGLLAGAVSACGGSAFFAPWAAFLIGAFGGLLAEGVVRQLQNRQIDDPANATAVHGAAGAWGLLAVGFFANGAAGRGLNGIDAPVRGLFFGGGMRQLEAQLIGAAADFVTVFALGYVALQVVQKILGNRVKLAEELQGLDWTQAGALGYQPDVESTEEP